MDYYSIFLASNGYYQHLAMNDWVSATKRVENFDTYNRYHPDLVNLNVLFQDNESQQLLIHTYQNFLHVSLQILIRMD
jgi:catechol-2,3-dioxygenase